MYLVHNVYKITILLHVCATSNGYQDKTQTFVLEFAECHCMGSGTDSDPVVTRIFQVSKVMNVLGQQSMANTTQAMNSTEFA